MKTKEEIIDGLFDYSTSDGIRTTYTYEGIGIAMDEHAKEVAIDFHKWVTHEHNWIDKVDVKFPTREVLFDLYLKSKE